MHRVPASTAAAAQQPRYVTLATGSKWGWGWDGGGACRAASAQGPSSNGGAAKVGDHGTLLGAGAKTLAGVGLHMHLLPGGGQGGSGRVPAMAEARSVGQRWWVQATSA